MDTALPAGLDAPPPPEMARKAEGVGAAKAEMPAATTFVLAVLAGAFIALGATFATTVTAGGVDLPYGVARLLAGLAFSLGLILVVVAGAGWPTAGACGQSWSWHRCTPAWPIRWRSRHPSTRSP